jgi:type 1 glutamine amidotransferase
MSTGSTFNPQHEISDRVHWKFFIDGAWKARSGTAGLDPISPDTEELLVITEWTLKGNVTEPCYYAGVSPTIPVSVHGVSIVLIDDGKVADWSDYYDKPSSRRAALASYFTEWIEL